VAVMVYASDSDVLSAVLTGALRIFNVKPGGTYSYHCGL
jgi:hypothetical protein